MAKIKFGMMMTDARGKLGGQVFSKNRSGAYVRTKVTPVNPRTAAQQLSRSILGTLSASWSGLTEVQRRSWNAAVDDWQRTDIFGDLRKPTGKNLFTSLNKELLQSKQSQVLLPPDKVVIPDIIINQAVYDKDKTTFAIQTAGDSTGFTFQVWATPTMTQGTTFIDDKLRVLDYTVGSNGASLEVKQAYDEKFGIPEDGANLWVQIKLIAPNGQASVPVRFKASVIS